jgi:K+-transporting ATPase KdpF subunit
VQEVLIMFKAVVIIVALCLVAYLLVVIFRPEKF